MNKEEREAKRAQLFEAPILHEWEYTGFGGVKGKRNTWLAALCAGVVGPVLVTLASLLFGVESSDVSLLCTFWGGAAILYTLMLRFLMSPEYHYHYCLTRLGIYYSQTDVFPESVYKAGRVVAWVGVGVCIAAVVLVGPMAFVGAGGMALLSFKFTSYESKTRYATILFSDSTVILDYKKDTILEVSARYVLGVDYVGKFYFSDENSKDRLSSTLREVLPEYMDVDLKLGEDVLKNPIYKEVLADKHAREKAKQQTQA
jgi:hypothetical protein